MGSPRTPLALKEQVMELKSLDTFVNKMMMVMMVIILIKMILLLLLMMIMTKTLCYVMKDPN